MRGARRGLAALSLAAALAPGCRGVDEAKPEREVAALGQEAATEAEAPREAAAPQRGTSSNEAPVIERLRFDPGEPTAGDAVRALADIRDGDGDALDVAFVWRLNGERLPANTDRIVLSEAKKGDILEVTVTAGDGRSVSKPASVSFTLRNRAPRIEKLTWVPDDDTAPGGKLALAVVVHDPDGDDVKVRFAWRLNGRILTDSGPELTSRRLRRGDRVRASVVPSDAEDEGESVAAREITISNATPAIVSEPTGPDADGVFRYQVAAEDPDGDRFLRFALGQGPEGMTVDERSGLVVWKPRQEQQGSHAIEIRVQDGLGGTGTQRFDLVVGSEDGSEGDRSPPAARAGG